MDYKSLKTLEYHKIIEKLSSYAGSEAARKICADLKPMTDINSINDALTQTSDALSRIYAKGSVSFSGVTNIIDSIKRLEVGSTLNTHELLNISAVLTTAASEKGPRHSGHSRWSPAVPANCAPLRQAPWLGRR